MLQTISSINYETNYTWWFFLGIINQSQTKVAKQKALERIVKNSYAFLETHSALETVVYTVSLLEDDELFNAGIGSQI